MRIVTWNINSVRLRLPRALDLIAALDPDVICLQETKADADKFPVAGFADAGYTHQAVRGFKGYNGVAIVSRKPFEETHGHPFCGREDARHIAARIADGPEIHNFYVPAGGDIPDPSKNDKFKHKLQFLTEMTEWFDAQRGRNDKMVLVGDLNIAPLETDVWSHKQLLDVVSHTPVEVEALGKVQSGLGWTDAVRQIIPEDEHVYSWWSYRAKDWRASNRGRRLDHVWVTDPLKGKVRAAEILVDARDWQKASDHVPVVVDLEV